MRVRLLRQPIEQHPTRFATELRAMLQRKGATKFAGFCAFALKAGINEIAPELKAFGALKRLYVGVDNKITSAQALEALLACGVDIRIVFSASGALYHPKTFVVEHEAGASVIIGSANLTGSALLDNIEFGAALEIDRGSVDDYQIVAELEEAERIIDNLGEEYVRRVVAQSDIDALLLSGDIEDERTRGRGAGWEPSDIGEPISAGSRDLSPPFGRTARRPDGGLAAGSLDSKIHTLPAIAGAHGPLVWEKRQLSASDAQIVRPGSNVTGNLKLSQAGYRVNGQLIDQTNYFRSGVFANLRWSAGVPERASVPARLVIRGVRIGSYNLELSHDPGRIANQNNTPTWLHWKSAMSQIQAANVTGEPLRIYGPDASGTYDIEIGPVAGAV